MSPELAELQSTDIQDVETELGSFIGEVENKDLILDADNDNESIDIVAADLDETSLFDAQEIEEELNAGIQEFDLSEAEEQTLIDLPPLIDSGDDVSSDLPDETMLFPAELKDEAAAADSERDVSSEL